MFKGPLTESILKRGQDDKLIKVDLHDIREWGIGKHKQVDDKPYGGGAGMLMRADVVVPAIEAVMERNKGNKGNKSNKGDLPWRILLTPRGKKLTQSLVERLAKKKHLLLICGHYEGVDERVVEGGWIDMELSIGDYVLTGGELPAMVLIDALARQIPGVLGKEESAQDESFSKSLRRKREYPHYTRPEEFRNLKVPPVLLSGHHREIEEWRNKRTK